MECSPGSGDTARVPAPIKLLITSPLRTGSTWVHAVLCDLFQPECVDFVADAEAALQVAQTVASCVLKTHAVFVQDVARLSDELQVIRILRNHVDCLISRALYCRNVRPAEGLDNLPREAEIIRGCAGMEDRAYVNFILSDEEVVVRWLDELAQFERGTFPYTFRYEALASDPAAEFRKWLVAAGVKRQVSAAALEGALERCSMDRMRAATTPGFVGSTGVGNAGWWLEPAVRERLEETWVRVKAAVGAV